MTRSIDVERALDALLAPDGVRVPDRVLETALDQVHDTRQVRRGLVASSRFLPVNTFARAAAMLIVAAVAIGLVALEVGLRGTNVGGPSPSAIPSPSPFGMPLPTLDATFVSPAYGYQIRYPTGWAVQPGTLPWQVGSGVMPDNPTTDKILSPVGPQRVRFSGASLLLPRGTTIDAFRANAVPLASPFNPTPCSPIAPLSGPVLLDVQTSPGASPQQVQAVVSINGCGALAELGGHVYDVEVIAGGRGYEFTLDGEITAADAVAWLATITLEPASAAAATAAPSPSTSK
jgi:hypothetical protein